MKCYEMLWAVDSTMWMVVVLNFFRAAFDAVTRCVLALTRNVGRRCWENLAVHWVSAGKILTGDVIPSILL